MFVGVRPMEISFTEHEVLDQDEHHFRILDLDDSAESLAAIASEYIKLRTECTRPIKDLEIDDIPGMDLDALRNRIKNATIPCLQHNTKRKELEVVRSDFGELLCYILLEKQYSTKICYKSIRNRELTQQTGRGIDVIGIESNEKLTLVLGEVKVSNESKSPPQIVNRGTECLESQQKSHIANRTITANKVIDRSRFIADRKLQNLFFRAAFSLEKADWDNLRLVSCCVLVRPQNKYTAADFGGFRSKPANYAPAWIRFLIIRVPGEIDPIIEQWYNIIEQMEVPPE